MQIAILVVAIALLAVIAYGDVRTRRIPNALTLGIAALGLARMLLAHDAGAAVDTLTAGAAIFAAAFLLFCRGAVGGGDVKLVAAMVLLVGHRDVCNFLFLMSVCGGILAVAALARDQLGARLAGLWRWACLPSPAKAAALAESSVPYGVAVAAAGAITLILAR